MTVRIVHTPTGFVNLEDLNHFEGVQTSAPAPTAPETRVYGGTTRFQMGEPEGPEHVPHTIHQHDASAGTVGGSIVATFSSTYGRPTVELIPGNPSSRTSVETALREGLIERNAAGQLVDKLQAAERLPTLIQKAPEKAPQDLSEGAFNPAEDQDWAADIDPLPQHGYDGAVASVVAHVALGQGSFEQTAKALAESAGIEPSLALDYVQQGYAMYERVVARAVAPLGLSEDRKDAFYAFTQTQPAKLQDAVQRLVHARDVSGFKSLAVDFKVANPPDATAYQKAGFQTAIDRTTGDLMVKHGKGDWRSVSSLK